jgi:hypothetical protein
MPLAAWLGFVLTLVLVTVTGVLSAAISLAGLAIAYGHRLLGDSVNRVLARWRKEQPFIRDGAFIIELEW